MQQQLVTLIPKSKKAAFVFRALNNPLRQKILSYIGEHPGCCVTEIQHHFRLRQSITSQQLSILRREGIVITKKEGKFVNYQINEQRLAVIELLAEQLCKN